MPENKFDNGLLDEAAKDYAALLEDTIQEFDKEAEALGLEVPDRLTNRLSRKYGLDISRPGRFRMCIAGIALALFVFVFTVSWFPHTAVAIVNAFHRLVFVDNGRSMEVHSEVETDPGFSIEVPDGFLSEGTFVVGKDITRTRFESPSDYIEITSYPDEYKVVYDNENDGNAKDIIINAYHGRIFRKNGVTTIVLDDSGAILEVESSLPEGDLVRIAESYKRNGQ